MKKYQVVGRKHGKGVGHVLSRHNSLRQAKTSAKRFANKGYHGAIHTVMKTKPHSRVHKFYSGGYKKKTWWRSRTSF